MNVADVKSNAPRHELTLVRHCLACLLKVMEVEHNKGKIKLRATDGTEKCTVALNSQICAQWASNEDLRPGCLLRLKADGLSYNQLQGELVRWCCRGHTRRCLPACAVAWPAVSLCSAELAVCLPVYGM